MTSRKASPPSLKKDGNQVYLQFCSGLLCNSIMNLIIFKPIAMNITPPLSVNLACAKFTCGKVKWVWSIHLKYCNVMRTKLSICLGTVLLPYNGQRRRRLSSVWQAWISSRISLWLNTSYLLTQCVIANDLNLHCACHTSSANLMIST